jgi:hypothetical protein
MLSKRSMSFSEIAHARAGQKRALELCDLVRNGRLRDGERFGRLREVKELRPPTKSTGFGEG